MSHSTLPLARQDDLVIHAAFDETLVYDRKTDKAHVLSPSAAAVWRACNGKRSVQEIAHYLDQESPTNEETVWYALGQLKELLEEPVPLPNEMRGMSRRQFLKRAGVVAGATAIPIVVSIVAPTPAHAQSAAFICCICQDSYSVIQEECAACSSVCATHGGSQDCAAASACSG